MADDGTGAGLGGADRREHERFDAELSVDWSSGENFLFSYITNISEMGIFIRSDDPPSVGTALRLRFGDDDPLELDGRVVWVNPRRPDGDDLNPGMGVRFAALTLEQRERIVQLVRTIAYLQGDGAPS
ncbi:MAG TPA: TIGR02266 family protein [Sandaracinaceae bacterium LLY-WYZ-13_1]|nr:TIGR02266 family protein [Sandaracinaceae bacterium LLY-WYZ-13_1]